MHYKDLILNKKNLYEIGVYKISNTINNKCYIGSTIKKGDGNFRGFISRVSEHYHKLLKNKHHSKSLQNHVNKYGIESIRFELIEQCSIETCRDREQYWIDNLDSFNKGFNDREKVDLTLGGVYHPRFINIDIDELRYLYLEKNMNCEDIGKIMGVSKNKINRALKINNIDIKSRYLRIPIKEIYYRFILGGETIYDLAKEFNVSSISLGKHIKKVGYPTKRESYILHRLEDIKKYISEGNTLKSYCYKTPINYTHVSNILNNEKR